MFQSLDVKVRETYLQSVVEGSQQFTVTLLNCLDMVSMSLLASRQALQAEHKRLVLLLVRLLSVIIKNKLEPENSEEVSSLG